MSSRYSSSVGGDQTTWDLEGNTLQCDLDGRKVNATVLSEELGYNKGLQQFKIFVLDRPLDPDYTVGTHAHTHTVLMIRSQICPDI